MRYVVTGGAGFIGSNFVRMLLNNQLGQVDSVKVIDKLTYAGNLDNLRAVMNDQRLEFIQGDICDLKLMKECIATGDILVNFAAESHVDRSINDPSDFVKSNVVGVQVLLSAAVETNAQMFVQISTDEVYGSVNDGHSVEEDPLLPNSPYAASKASADLLVRSFAQTFGLDTRVTRCCNNYGPNQFPEKLIPLAIERLKSGQRIPIYGDGMNVREWIHVDDHCRGVELVISKGKKGEIYNLGSGETYTNLELIKMLLKKLNRKTEEIFFVPDRKGHDLRYSLDSTKARTKLGFETSVDLSIGLDRLLESVDLKKP